MSKEIKFKFWLEDKKEMTKPYTLDELLNGGWHDIPKHKTLEFTGLLDKNGKEIYEGDIVEYDEVSKHGEHVTDRWIVEWVKQLGAYQLVNCRPDIQADFIYEVGESLLEVIGNVFEDPDLLTTNT